MPLVKNVTLTKEQICNKCKGILAVGEIAVKDRSHSKKIGKVYYHTECQEEQVVK